MCDHQLRGEKMMRKKVHKTRLLNLFTVNEFLLKSQVVFMELWKRHLSYRSCCVHKTSKHADRVAQKLMLVVYLRKELTLTTSIKVIAVSMQTRKNDGGFNFLE